MFVFSIIFSNSVPNIRFNEFCSYEGEKAKGLYHGEGRASFVGDHSYQVGNVLFTDPEIYKILNFLKHGLQISWFLYYRKLLCNFLGVCHDRSFVTSFVSNEV